MSTDLPPQYPWWREYRRELAWAFVSVVTAIVGVFGGWQAKPTPPPVVEEKIVEVPAPGRMLAEMLPIDYEGTRFGGCDDHDGPQPVVQAARWPADRITYGIDYASARGMTPPLSDVAVQAALKQAAGWWAEHLQIELVEVPYTAGPHIPIRFERIDGPGGVLAEAYLADGTARPKPLRFDSGERWTPGAPAANLVSLPTVACHELGHSLGLDHDAQNAPAVMRPTYTSAIPREQERDIGRMVGLGYKRREKVPPAPTDVLSFPVQVKTDDVIEALKKAGYKVEKP